MTPEQITFVRTVRAALKSDSAREVLAALTAPQRHAESSTVQHVKGDERLAWEQAVVADLTTMFQLCTNDGANAVSRTRQLKTTANMLAAAANAKAMFPDRVEAINKAADRCLAHYVQFLADGGAGMIHAHFGQSHWVETVEVAVEGPSIWAEMFPGEHAPTLESVAEAMA